LASAQKIDNKGLDAAVGRSDTSSANCMYRLSQQAEKAGQLSDCAGFFIAKN